MTIRKYALEISDLTLADSGKYYCKAFNQYGELWGNFTVTVVEEMIGNESGSTTTKDTDSYEEGDSKLTRALSLRSCFLLVVIHFANDLQRVKI